jgi:biopolymer transport protein ExbB
MKFKFFQRMFAMLGAGLLLSPYYAFAADVAHTAVKKVTLWNLLVAGGWTMCLIGVLSIVTVALVIYNFLTLKIETLIPLQFTENLVTKLENHDLQGAQFLCQNQKNNIIASIALAGLSRHKKGRVVMHEAMDNTARREISRLWQNITYLGDIATIAPLLGLFGTVLGMIEAFNTISYAGTGVKPMMLVGGISMALVSTAAGLIVAIPALSFYSLFRGKVQEISDNVGDEIGDLMKLVEEPVAQDLETAKY